MTTLLQINSSIFSSGGNSSQLADAFVAQWQGHNPDARIKVRDLASDPLPHLDAQRVEAFLPRRKPEQRSSRPMSRNPMH